MPSVSNPTPLAPPAQAAADGTVPKDWHTYAAKEHAIWDTLFARKAGRLPKRATDAFLEGLDVPRFSKSGIPDFVELSARLAALAAWSVVAVPGLVPDALFFDHLARRRFVAGRFIRTLAQLDDLQKLDVFNHVFGHSSLLANRVRARGHAEMRRRHAIYATGSGRINLAGLNADTLPIFVGALEAYLTGAFA